jgi:hypothetical protein
MRQQYRWSSKGHLTKRIAPFRRWQAKMQLPTIHPYETKKESLIESLCLAIGVAALLKEASGSRLAYA